MYTPLGMQGGYVHPSGYAGRHIHHCVTPLGRHIHHCVTPLGERRQLCAESSFLLWRNRDNEAQRALSPLPVSLLGKTVRTCSFLIFLSVMRPSLELFPRVPSTLCSAHHHPFHCWTHLSDTFLTVLSPFGQETPR